MKEQKRDNYNMRTEAGAIGKEEGDEKYQAREMEM